MDIELSMKESSKMIGTEALLKSFQFSLNERMVNREKKKENTVNEIHALEIEIAKLMEAVKLKQKQKEEKKNEEVKRKMDEKNKQTITEDQICLQNMLKRDYEHELKKEEFKLKERMEKQLRVEKQKMEKKTKDLIVHAKENNLKMCLACGDRAAYFPSCSECNDAYYCNETCQEEHWKVHQYYCSK